MNEAKEDIVKIIRKMAGKYSADMIFTDWVLCSAIATQNACYLAHDKTWNDRENRYINTMKKYTTEERRNMVNMLGLLADAFEEEMSDMLGEIYMESGQGSKQTGQFFTPFHISKLTAGLTIPKKVSEKHVWEINEPSVGGGGMIIAAAKTLKEKGIDYQHCMKVTAQDLDWRSVYMAYVQFSMLGIDAVVVQGNTLSESYVNGKYPKECVLQTPKRMGVLL